MKGLWKKILPRKKSFAAVDIGSREIKVVQLDFRSRLPEVEVVARFSTPPGALGENLDEETLVGVLEQAVVQSGLTVREVTSAVGGNRAVIRYLKLPAMPPRELESAVRYEAEKTIPVPLDEMVLDYVYLGETGVDGVKQVEVMFAAVPVSLSYQYYALFSRAGLTLTALDLQHLALWRLFCGLSQVPPVEEDTWAIVDMGATCTDLVVVEGRSFKFSRTLPVGGDLLTESIAESCGVDFERAEAMKTKDAEVLTDENLFDVDAGKMQLDFSMRDGLGEIVREIRRSLDFYNAREDALPIRKIVLTGGAGKLRGLSSFLTEAVEVPVVKMTPPLPFFEHVEYDPAFAVAFGLALRGAD